MSERATPKCQKPRDGKPQILETALESMSVCLCCNCNEPFLVCPGTMNGKAFKVWQWSERTDVLELFFLQLEAASQDIRIGVKRDYHHHQCVVLEQECYGVSTIVPYPLCHLGRETQFKVQCQSVSSPQSRDSLHLQALRRNMSRALDFQPGV